MITAKDKKVEDILNLSNKVFIALLPTVPQDLPLPELTMQQFRIVMLLFIGGSMRMSCIAQLLKVSTPTATGIVDRLVEQDLVKRKHDLEDRRVVICQLAPHGRKLISQTWQSFRNNTKEILMSMPEDGINIVSETLMLLLETGKTMKKDVNKECIKSIEKQKSQKYEEGNIKG
jgi:DNA-binding MarR family transcriptional regulator